MKWVTENPNYQPRPKSSFKGLSLHEIPATPDSLLDSPNRMAIFLRSANGRNPWLRIGSSSGPSSFISYRRALAMFGEPATHTESTPKTEREWCEKNTVYTVPILSEEEQWALFRASIGGWPDVEGHDFAGLTNWIHRCMETDKKFLEVTLPSWKKEREDHRATTIEKLSKLSLKHHGPSG
ncbi:unnamed protein product [Aureobasidium vineae]|uniref:Uncharacterized protein n=1 Tax=Aureobasidium vineae TaxID=2773715 RepID=A0A9N8JGB0_9PEZI|nr:unnamed protein product [Aureobasidium vineae]